MIYIILKSLTLKAEAFCRAAGECCKSKILSSKFNQKRNKTYTMVAVEEQALEW